MKTLVVMTGPQGSGNHLFSKVLATNSAIFGWTNLLKTYWEGHDQEPFAEYWMNPEQLSTFNWDTSDVFVTSISCPFFYKGTECIPDYERFIEEARKYCKVKVLIIGRDENILKFQQERVRERHTAPDFIEQIDSLMLYNPLFVSQELLYLYRLSYLNSIENFIGIPVSTDDTQIEEILKENANTKYIEPVTDHWLDEEVFKAVHNIQDNT